MKKIIIFSIILFGLISLSNAISINLGSGQKLDNSNWTNLSSVLNKVDTSGNNLNINGKFSVDGKIFNESGCLGECVAPATWDTATSSCKAPQGTTKESSGSSCLSILQGDSTSVSKIYWIDPNGGDTSDAFQVYCDMTTDGGGWTRISNTSSISYGYFTNTGISTLTNYNLNNTSEVYYKSPSKHLLN